VTYPLGLIMSIEIHNANINDKKSAKQVLQMAMHKFERLNKILADQGYTSELVNRVGQTCR
jgi:hypothetical protein